ncbi:MAG: hypothetical protein JJ975_10895 [Bacteroidia bacterium]|nr:hypothetical protein [Bacteroidia bacterium]
MVDYTILKLAGDSCGDNTDFRLEIVPSSGYKFENMQINETTGHYVTKVTVNLSQNSGGVAIKKHLCNAPVVCSPDSVELTIVTHVPNLPDKEEKKNYRHAQNG